MNTTVFQITALLALAALTRSAHADVRVYVSQVDRYDIEQGQGSAQLALPAIPLSSGAVRASADELRGQLRTFANGVYDTTAAEARLSDDVRFTVSGSEPVTAYLHTWFTGQLTFAQAGLAAGGIELRSAQRDISQYNYRNSYLQSHECKPESQPWVTCTVARAIAERVSLPIALRPGEQTVFIQAELLVFAYLDASADFGNSAYAWLEVPDGVTWASTTPGFLSLATAVPEPAVGALWACGLAGLVWLQRRRRAGAPGF